MAEFPRYGRKILVMAIALGLLFFLIRRAGWNELGAAFAGANFNWIPLILLLYVVNTMTKALRWFLLLRIENPEIRYSTVLPLVIVNLGINSLIPGRVAGEPVRVLLLKRREEEMDVGFIFSTVILEKYLDFLTLSLVSFFGIILLFSELWDDGSARSILIVALALSLLFIGLVFLPIRGSWFRKANPGSFFGKIIHKVINIAGKIRRSLRAFKGHGRSLGVTMGITLLIWINEAVRLYLILLMLRVDIDHLVSVFVASSFASLSGFILPLGVGNAVAITAIFVLAGISEHFATAASLMMISTSIWISMLLMAIILVAMEFGPLNFGMDDTGLDE